MTRRHQHGFTVIETMLALVLSSLVIGALLTVYQTLHTSERVGGERLEQAADIAVTQNVIRRIMGNLVAAAPMDPNELIDDEEAEDDEPGDSEDGAEDEESRSDTLDDAEASLEEQAVAGLGMEDAIVPTIAPGTPVMFELMWETFDDGVRAQSLEVVVSRAPVQLRDAADTGYRERRAMLDERPEVSSLLTRTIRGRIEVAEHADGWALQWRQIDPPSEPFVLIRQITWLEWTILPITREVDDWTDVHAAFLAMDFPAAVRMQVWTDKGAREDWLFEPIVTIQE